MKDKQKRNRNITICLFMALCTFGIIAAILFCTPSSAKPADAGFQKQSEKLFDMPTEKYGTKTADGLLKKDGKHAPRILHKPMGIDPHTVKPKSPSERNRLDKAGQDARKLVDMLREMRLHRQMCTLRTKAGGLGIFHIYE